MAGAGKTLLDLQPKVLERRDRRCLKTNRYYQRIHSPTVSGHAVTDLDPAALAQLLADPDAPFQRPDVILLKNSRSSTVAEWQVRVHGELRPVIYKRFRITAGSDPWVNRLRLSPALRSWVWGQGLRERQLPTARPLAVLHRRRRGLCYEGYLLTEKIPDAVDLHGLMDELHGLTPTSPALCFGCTSTGWLNSFAASTNASCRTATSRPRTFSPHVPGPHPRTDVLVHRPRWRSGSWPVAAAPARTKPGPPERQLLP